ncbi:Alpha/Beta hydrolase protein [Diplogelasinospora grovesii]|uniref:Alpha/Beta hydrolase protein n=1 Tax=Diplogelasinospora grovesii TaxID=303347 RepID=A0AAN6N5N5_9PEZI|nr:Alpha/Beta hydrolase protein [Diplogelasinospora grovesii]
MTEQQYFIKDAILKHAVHHDSFQKLWETKWKAPCAMGIYPFMFGSIKDFQPIVDAIIEKGLKEPYDWDEYAEMFFEPADDLMLMGINAEQAGRLEEACEYLLRSSAVYRIARFPAPRSGLQKFAWARCKNLFYQGARLMEYPITEALIPHTHRLSSEGKTIPVGFLFPPNATPDTPCPLVMIMTGLDGYRTELAVWQRGWLDKGVATLVVEIPGTGDSPADPKDPTSPDRQWSSVLDWISQQTPIDPKKIIVWGFSTGGYYSLRIAHTHNERLLGSVSLGGGCHHMFDREWLSHVNHLEYPFDLADTLAYKFGYDNLEEFIKEAGKFSLVNDGTLDRECCRTLLVNGDRDEIFPIDDLYVALSYGGPKLARVVKDKKHMGEPDSFLVILKWIHGLLGLDGDVESQLRQLPTKCKY